MHMIVKGELLASPAVLRRIGPAMELKETLMPETVGTVGAALLTHPHGASELLVGLVVGLVLLAFWMRPAPRERHESAWKGDHAPTHRA